MKHEYKRYYKIIDTSEAVLFFMLLNKDISDNPVVVFILDKKTMEFKKLTTLQKVDGFKVISLNDKSDNFIYCISLILNQVCYVATYKNKKLTLRKFSQY